MTRGGKSIVWKQWKDAFNWDQSNFSLPLHERLTLAHIELDPASRMRNHLAEDVLDSKMLFMMQSYRDHIMASTDNQDQQEDGTPLDSALQLLQHTSQIIDLFNSKCPITNINDSRMKKLNSFYAFMLDWREESTDDNSTFISSKLWFDIQSMCLGFNALVQISHSHASNLPLSIRTVWKITFAKSDLVIVKTIILLTVSSNQHRIQ